MFKYITAISIFDKLALNYILINQIYCFHMHKLFDSINPIIDACKYLMPSNQKSCHIIDYKRILFIIDACKYLMPSNQKSCYIIDYIKNNVYKDHLAIFFSVTYQVVSVLYFVHACVHSKTTCICIQKLYNLNKSIQCMSIQILLLE